MKFDWVVAVLFALAALALLTHEPIFAYVCGGCAMGRAAALSWK